MHVDGGVRQGVAATFCTGSQQHGPEGSSDANSYGTDRVRNHLHRVIDRKTSIDHTTRRINVHVDLSLGIFMIQEQ